MTVRANVINLTSLVPTSDLGLVIDTNILFWLGYSRATDDVNIKTRLRPYSAFIRRAANVDMKFHCTMLSVVEAMHKIERDEFKRIQPRSSYSQIKVFRQSAANRDAVADELDSFWASAKTLVSVLPASIPLDRAEVMLQNKREAQADAYDLAIVETAKALGYKMIVSDDADLITYDCGLAVVTANPTALRLAVAQGKLIAPGGV